MLEHCGQTSQSQRAMTLVELLFVLSIIAMLLLILFPAVQASRQAARQLQCQSNLRGWGQAIHAYLAVWGHYPPAAIVGRASQGRVSGWARHGLFTFLLPHVDQTAVLKQIDLHFDWNSSRNVASTKQNIAGILICPAAPGRHASKHATDYTAAVRIDPSDRTGLGKLLHRGRIRNRTKSGPPGWGSGEKQWAGLLRTLQSDRSVPVSRQQLRTRTAGDGTGRTLLLVENAGKPICYRHGRLADCQITRFRWASPTTWMTINDFCQERQLVNCHNNSQPYGFHPNSLNVLYADGSVRRTSDAVDADILIAAVTCCAND